MIDIDKVIVIVGPTASGKTALSIDLAKKLNGEIISSDSMQIYKELDIGTAKVTEEEKQGIKHHLIDIKDINESFSVAEYKDLCYNKIAEIIKNNKIPIIIGGTGLYVSAVIKDMEFTDENIDLKYRDELYELAKNNSNEYVHDMLKKIDIDSASAIHPNNLKRVIRALEMNKLGMSKSRHMENENNRLQEYTAKYDFKVFCINVEKSILHDRINKRVDMMIEQGLEQEARKIYNLSGSSLTTRSQAMGYKEFFDYFNNVTTKEQVIDDIKLRTRQYAKRQMTWFRKLDAVNYLDYSLTKEEMIDVIKRHVYE